MESAEEEGCVVAQAKQDGTVMEILMGGRIRSGCQCWLPSVYTIASVSG